MTQIDEVVNEFQERMCLLGLHEYNVRIVDNRQEAVKGDKLRDWPEIEEFCEKYCHWLIKLNRECYSFTL